MYKLILIFFVLIFSDFALSQGDAPALLKGQEQSSNQVGAFIQTPNSQVTRINSATGLLETGNKNILINPNFEHSTATTGWTNNGTEVGVAETTVVVDGKKSLFFNPSSETINLVQSSTTYQAQFADGVQCLASARVKSAASGIKLCSVQAGTVSTTNCVDVVANSKWAIYKVPFICGATSNGISISSTGSNVTGAVYVDDAFVGAVDLKADVDQSRIAGEAYFAGTASCNWSRTSTTVGAFGSTAACPGPTIVYSSMGAWQTTDSDLPRVTINNLPAGVYKAKFIGRQVPSANTSSVLAINDGTTTCEPTYGNANTVSGGIITECTFTYSQSGNRVFELYTASPTGSVTLANDNSSSPRGSLKFILEYFGSGSVYTSTNADTDWAPCNFSTFAWQGLGTVTSSLECKRQGSDLLMRNTATLGTVGASQAQIPLPLWNGVQLTSARGGTIGRIERGNASANSVKDIVAIGTQGAAFFTLSYPEYSLAQSPFASVNGNAVFANTDVISVNLRIPIAGWTNSNIIIGQFNGLESCTDSYDCTDVFSAKVSSTGVVSGENIDWISGNCAVTSTSTFTCTHVSGIFTQEPNCTITTRGVSGASTQWTKGAGSSSSQTIYVTASGSSVAEAQAAEIICQKQGADYIGKTAKAVASDQNIATPGVTKVRSCMVAWGGSGSLGSPANCTGSPCTEYFDSCGAVSSITRSGAGTYTATFANGTFANTTPVSCKFGISNGANPLYASISEFVSNSSGGFVPAITSTITGGANSDSRVSMICTGVGP